MNWKDIGRALVLLMCAILFWIGIGGLQEKRAQTIEISEGDIEPTRDTTVWPSLAEAIQSSEGEITNVLVTLYFYDTKEEMQAEGEIDDVDGYSYCSRDVEQNIAYCEVHIPRPRIVDGHNSWTLGHEVLHGVYGAEYHQ